MRHDLEILQALFLPPLEEIATYSKQLADAMARGEAFWVYLNGVVLDGRIQVQELLTGYGAKDVEQYSALFESLEAEYLACLAQGYCTGQTNPTVELLLQAGNASFAAEVAFEKDMLAAITQVGRAAIKAELEHAAEFVDADIAGEEIAAAFSALQKDAAREDLRKQLKQWDDEQEPARVQPARNKKRRAIPLLFLRFAAAAAVFTVATVGVVKVYNHKSRDGAPGANYHITSDTNGVSQTPMAADTIAGANIPQPEKPTTQQRTTGIDSSAGGSDPTTAIPAHLPRIVLKGSVVDVGTDDLVKDVMVTMLDDKGDKQTVFSKDGTFSFELPLHRDFAVTGKKENYQSARLSLSTKDVKDTDPDDEINTTLRLTKEF